ncbi:MAG: amino acid transporter, partial [Gemmatimonadota bacterium]
MSDGLRRSIGLRDLTLGVIGSVIGSGIFLVPGGVLAQAQHSIGTSLLVWFGGGLLTLIGALTYSEL